MNKLCLTNLSPLKDERRVERRQQVHAVRTKEEVIIVDDREPVSVIEGADGLVKRHGLDVEGGEDCLLVCHGRVIVRGNLGMSTTVTLTLLLLQSF